MILVRWTEPPPPGPHRWLAGSHSGRMAGQRGSPGGCSRGSSSCTHPDPQCSQYRSRKLCSNFRCTTMSKLFNSLVCCALCSARSFFLGKFIVRSRVALSSPFAFQENIAISTWFTSRLIIRLIAVEAVLMRQEGHVADTFSGLHIIAVSVILAGLLLHTSGRVEGSVSMNMVHRQFNRVCIFCF